MTASSADSRLVTPSSALLLLLIVALGVGLRLYGLDRESAWLDEAFSITIARDGLDEVFYQTQLDVHPPLYYVLLTGWLALVGDSVRDARLLSVVISTLVIVAGYVAAARLTSRATGLATAAILAVSVFQIEFAQEARMYSLLTLAATLSTIGFVGIFEPSPRPRALVLYTLATMVLVYTHVYGLFVVTAQVALLAIDLAWRRRAALPTAFAWLGAAAVVLVAFLVWLPVFTWQVSLVQTRFWIAEPEPSGLVAAFERYAGSPTLLPIVTVVAGIGVLALMARQVARPPRPALFFLLPWCAGPIVVPFVLSLLGTPIFLPKYTIPASVPFAIFAAAAMQVLPLRPVRWLATAAFVALLARPLPDFYATTVKDGWREAVTSVEALAAPGDAIVLYPYFNTIAFDLYKTRPDLLVRPLALFTEPPPGDGWPRTIRRATGGRDRVWLVTLEADTSSEAVVSAITADRALRVHLVRQKIEVFGFDRP